MHRSKLRSHRPKLRLLVNDDERVRDRAARRRDMAALCACSHCTLLHSVRVCENYLVALLRVVRSARNHTCLRGDGTSSHCWAAGAWLQVCASWSPIAKSATLPRQSRSNTYTPTYATTPMRKQLELTWAASLHELQISDSSARKPARRQQDAEVLTDRSCSLKRSASMRLPLTKRSMRTSVRQKCAPQGHGPATPPPAGYPWAGALRLQSRCPRRAPSRRARAPPSTSSAL